MPDESTAQPGVEPTDPYSPDWLDFYQRNPGYRRSVGADGVNDQGGEAAAEAPAEGANGQTQEPGPDDETDQETDGDAEDPDGTEEEQPEEYEWDFGGDKYKFAKNQPIPEDVASELDRRLKGAWSDYSRKQGDIAQRAKSIEAREAAVDKMQGLQGEVLTAYSRGLQIRSEIEQLGKIDLGALWQSDPDQARRVSDTISAKRAEFQGIVETVNHQEQQLNQAQQAERARRADEGRKAVEGAIKGFNADKVMKFAIAEGIPEKDAKDWSLNPIVTRWAWEAMELRELRAKAKTAIKPAPQQAQPVKPMVSKGGGKPSLDLVKDADKMSGDEWLRRRNQQIAKQRQA